MNEFLLSYRKIQKKAMLKKINDNKKFENVNK